MVSKVLVANRGEIACRILRACREAGLTSVAIYAANDSKSLFVELADQAILLEGDSITETYLNQRQILEIAESTGADALHPGFGFLSERADFARAVTQAGIQWIGPSPSAIEKMGDKMTARITMRDAGVPVIPGEEIETEDETEALIAIEQASTRVGYPLLLKASSGGGGKGMRAVEHPEDLLEAARSARREALAAFGDGRVYLERLLTGSKHVEIQILADRHGRIIHLGERECSVQRRHQKVFEEAPCSTMTEEIRSAMGKAAVAAAMAVNYEGAGTVEFLLAPSGEFFFLEMNTRIQVEHPVTELVTGVDIVREQLRIAAGEPMSCGELHMRGHAIEVRLYAEDAAQNFLPAIGPLAVFQPPEGPGIRLDTGVREGDEVTPNYDPMLAKLIVWAPSRDEALQRMRRALDEFVVLGTTTNIRFLRELCDVPDVVEGTTDTTMIDRLWPEGWSPSLPIEFEDGALMAAAVAESAGLHRQSTSMAESNEHTGPVSPFMTLNRRYP
ncbi:MAG: ATP-grasp domain-containing protein [Euryarchaeota archaeon]|nr:ATP-grasp domain-containing protein [Euryarchaeota archaeon]MBT6844463.1 ATP-grasp domain-containing protein [Euryarchaeota archaeon]MBT7064172.1 ATP-grasp domain-containing protein [Euryarchaeota archaeon]MBT7638485.1 ATP-grasp domain-containing protein [Euryarchaeota archaeon]